jgi:1-hydroxycarotenoid 3,4-desaturase
VEQDGVWLVRGGMQRLAVALTALAVRRGAVLRCSSRVREICTQHGRATAVVLSSGERIDAAAVICAADAGALAAGRLGAAASEALPPIAVAERSLSALTWAMDARAGGMPLLRHTVFFSADYPEEFRDLIDRGRLPSAPTVYVCAQDRDAQSGTGTGGAERLLILVNAPPIGDRHRYQAAEIEQCASRVQELLGRCGLTLSRPLSAAVATTPTDFEQRFPGMGGALYGAMCRGWRAPFRRPAASTRIAGLYLAGGSTHPGPGVPMAALSGRLAARTLLADLDSTSRSRSVAIGGGISMR